MGRRRKRDRNKKNRKHPSQGSASRASATALGRLALILWFVCACLLAIIGAYWQFGRPSKVQLGATLRTFDQMQFSYEDPSQMHISPVCGCWNEQESEIWRGVSFASRSLTISRSGSAPLTAYVITAPWPAEIFNGGPWLALPSKTFGPVASSFDPAVMLKQFSAQALPETGRNIVTSVQYAILIADQPLHIRQFGDTPFEAWLPVGESKVSIRPQLAFFTSSANVVELQETYKDIRIGTPRKPRTIKTIYSREDLSEADSNAEVPALDILGKRTILWTEGPHASVWLSEHFEEGALTVGQDRFAVGVVIDPVFSARVAVVPTNREALARFTKVEHDEMLPQPQDWLAVPGAGSISVKLERTSDELDQFDQVVDRLKKHDALEHAHVKYPQAVLEYNRGQDAFLYQNKAMDFRYPPVLPGRGFNIFGEMKHLLFLGATGNVVLGSKTVDIAAPSTLEFRDIKSFKAARGIVPIEVHGRLRTLDTELMFSGVSEAWLNGEPLNRVADRFGWSTGIIAMIAGIIQAIAAAFALLATVFASSEERRAASTTTGNR